MPLIFVGGGQRVEMEKPTLFSPALASSHMVRSLETCHGFHISGAAIQERGL